MKASALPTLIPLEPFREAFERMAPSERSGPAARYPKDAANTIAMRLGWFHDGCLDGPRVRRTLGIRPDPPSIKRGKFYPPKLREFVHYETALRLCEAMDIDPVDVGL